jgi:SAM-dependent methyltransferase
MGFASRILDRLNIGKHRANLESEIEQLKLRFDADPNFGSDDAIRYMASVTTSDRSKYWTAPAGLLPDQSSVSSTFSTIYGKNVWGGGSGGGSELRNVALYTAFLEHFIKSHDVRSIVDLGCGDWRSSKYLHLDPCQYLGVDVVASVIAANQKTYGSDSVRFEVADAANFSVPDCDLLICKDVLQHLSNANISKVLSRVKRARWALITNDYHPANEESRNGDTRPLDVTRAPFVLAATPRLAFNGKVTFLVERDGNLTP